MDLRCYFFEGLESLLVQTEGKGKICKIFKGLEPLLQFSLFIPSLVLALRGAFSLYAKI